MALNLCPPGARSGWTRGIVEQLRNHARLRDAEGKHADGGAPEAVAVADLQYVRSSDGQMYSRGERISQSLTGAEFAGRQQRQEDGQ